MLSFNRSVYIELSFDSRQLAAVRRYIRMNPTRNRWIKAVPYGLPPRFDPSVEDSEHLAAHRELILSAFDLADFSPFKITRTGLRAEPQV